MIKSSYLGFLLFVSMMTAFFILPDPEGLQKPFRIIIGLSFIFTYLALIIKKTISYKTLYPIFLGGVLIIIMFLRGSLQTSFINAYLCLFGIFCLPHLFFKVTPLRQTNLNYIHIICVVSILVQFLIYSSADGRPKLTYELNLSGAYLFLFFICSDILKNKYVKPIIIILSFLTLSRLLIFSIILYYLVKHGKKYFRIWLTKVTVIHMALAAYIFMAFFSFWYISNVKKKMDYDTSIKRIVTLNDDSNRLRFIANTLVISNMLVAPLSEKVLLGFGKFDNFTKKTKSIIMPHNELFDSIMQFGVISVLFFSIFSLSMYRKVTSFENIEYLIPLLFYTLILWVRFLLIPSFEMLFILFLLNIAKKYNSHESQDFQSRSL